MSDVDCAQALLRGEIDVDQYWRKSGEQRVKLAGVLLTEQQQSRALKNLSRLTVRLRQTGFECVPTDCGEHPDGMATDHDDLQQAFERHLVTYR